MKHEALRKHCFYMIKFVPSNIFVDWTDLSMLEVAVNLLGAELMRNPAPTRYTRKQFGTTPVVFQSFKTAKYWAEQVEFGYEAHVEIVKVIISSTAPNFKPMINTIEHVRLITIVNHEPTKRNSKATKTRRKK